MAFIRGIDPAIVMGNQPIYFDTSELTTERLERILGPEIEELDTENTINLRDIASTLIENDLYQIRQYQGYGDLPRPEVMNTTIAEGAIRVDSNSRLGRYLVREGVNPLKFLIDRVKWPNQNT